MADIVLINPRFQVSYWGLEHALPLLGKKCNLPTACLPLLAALTPAGHSVTIVDENVESIDYDRLAKADIVGLTGMTVQRARMLEILRELKTRDVFTIVGGPWVSVQEDYFDGLADAIFIGEAETTWPQFLEEWAEGRHQYRYQQAEATDMTQVPVPRYDLLKSKDYLFGSVQFSRGCPFQCEFCDIIVTFGRRPRLKTSAQVIAELEAMRKQHLKMAFIVDDNLIGNKTAVKGCCATSSSWQTAEGYPFTFFTEASLNLAEDDELMQLMDAANIVTVFIGIESPNEESLRETKKYQNVKKTGLDRRPRPQSARLRHRSLVRHDRRLRPRRHPDLQGPARVPPPDRHHARHGRHALGDPEDAAARSLEERRPPRSRRRTTVRHQCHSARHDARRVARRVRRPDAGTVRSRLLLRAARKPLPHKEIRLGSHSQCLLAQTPVAEAGSRNPSMRVLAAGLFLRLMKNVPDPELRRIYRRRMATMAPPTARPKPVVHLRDQVRDALPPLHNVAPDG